MVIHRYGLLVLSYLVKNNLTGQSRLYLTRRKQSYLRSLKVYSEQTRTFDSAFWETSIVQVKNRFQPPIPLAIRMSTSAGIFQARRF